MSRGDFAGAREACLKVLARDPQHADAQFLLGMAAAGGGQYREAAALIRRALERAPERAEYHAQLARCLALLEDSAAVDAAERAIALRPADALTWDTAGVVLARFGLHERAASALDRAVAAAPGNPAYRFNLATELQFLGRLAEAEEGYEAAVNIAPGHYRAHFSLAHLRKQTSERNHLPRLRALLAALDARDVDGELYLRHALAKECEDVGLDDEAFAHLVAGKARKRAQLGYSIDADRAVFQTVQRLFTAQHCAEAGRGDSSAAPIFVIGMPRTGTTLVERILASHSDVHSAGELPDFALCVKRAAGTPSRRVLDAETLERAVPADAAALAASYLASTKPRAAGKPRFVDKAPLNFFYVGFIHAALPAAKIVCLRRHPLDTCLSNFRQLFALGFSYYDYSYDLQDTGRYYAMFDRLMTHWRTVLPGVVLELKYERLVSEPEAQTRRLLEFCGLPWQPQCLRFHENAAPVATASAAQVRAPLNAGSIGRWRRYERQLKPLIETLREAGVALE